MSAEIIPGRLCGTVTAPASKSEAQRAILAAALADRSTCLTVRTLSQDIEAMIGAAKALGADVRCEGECLFIHPCEFIPERPSFDCGESGAVLRFLLPTAAALFDEAEFCGRGRLSERPIDELTSEMASHGVSFSGERLPFAIRGKLCPGEYHLSGKTTSQHLSGLLFALPLLEGESRIVVSGRQCSAPYVRMTIDTLERFGVNVTAVPEGYVIAGKQRYRTPGAMTVGGDWSSAALLLAAGAINGCVTVKGLDLSSAQGDRLICELLGSVGARVTAEGDSVTCRKGRLRGGAFDMSETPDLVPVMAVVAAFAEGETRLSGCERLRGKESDRLDGCVRLIRALGGRASAERNELVVYGGGLRGGDADGCDDHRMVMAAAVAAAGCAETVRISGARAAGKSWPGFFEAYAELGGAVLLREEE